MLDNNNYIVITGPTASGKTHKAVILAHALDGEIISADSRQVFRGMDIGTGKDINEYGTVPYHMIDVIDAGEPYNLYTYLRDARICMNDIFSRRKTPVVCGGSGMYVENLINGRHLPQVPENPELRRRLDGLSLDELTRILSRYRKLHNTTDTDTAKRAIRAIEIEEYYKTHPQESPSKNEDIDLKSQPLVIVIDIDRETRRAKITQRLHQRLDDGMVDEVRGLLDNGVSATQLETYGLEYRFVTQYIAGQLDYNGMVNALNTAIHQFAKRQMTWFRGMQRRGFRLEYLSAGLPDNDFVESALNLWQKHRQHQ